MSKRVLMVAYPLLPVTERSAGGAEQVLWTLERELHRRGWHTTVAACSGSEVSGELLVTGPAAEADDRFAEREEEHSERILAACAVRDFDIVLDHSGHFFHHAAAIPQKVLATLHLPRELYPAASFDNLAPNVYFHCVSQAQLRQFKQLPNLLGVVRNGIAVERFPIGQRRGESLLWLGRICPEKAPHLAIQIAREAGLPLVIAGQVYPFQWHRRYWEDKVLPHIDGVNVRWIELPAFEQKLQLLRESKALLVTSVIGETTSLAALESMACGTPVIAMDGGALSEVVPRGAGFVVHTLAEAVSATRLLSDIRSRDCRLWVEKEYSAVSMAESCEALIFDLEEQRRWQQRRSEEQ